MRLILAVVISMFIVLSTYEPQDIFMPLMVGSLFGYKGVLRRRLYLSTQAKSDFLSRMSHEFRTPLTPIIGFSQIVWHKPTFDAESAEQDNRIYPAGQHLPGLVEDVLERSRLEADRILLKIDPLVSNNLIDRERD